MKYARLWEEKAQNAAIISAWIWIMIRIIVGRAKRSVVTQKLAAEGNVWIFHMIRGTVGSAITSA